MSALGEMVKGARSARGLSLEEAATMLTCSKAQLHAIESGASTNPTLRTVASLVIVFGLRPEAVVATAVDHARAEGGGS